MPRVVGVEIPDNKRTVVALTYIFGVGRASATRICAEIGIPDDRRARDLTEDEISKIVALLERDMTIEGQLRRREQQDLARLRDIGCYRGLRHRRGLPVRGQRTRTNARTRKGRKKTVATKRSVKSMRG